MVLCRHPALDNCQNAMLLGSRKVPGPQEGTGLLKAKSVITRKQLGGRWEQGGHQEELLGHE